MEQTLKTIDVGGVNCFLLKTNDGGFVLVDTGISSKRDALAKELESAGCRPGTLKLIILTHGDVDHADNAAYLRERYGTKIAMHAADAGMVEHGNMGWNRKARPDRVTLFGNFIMLISKILQLSGKAGKFKPFTPDLTLEDGQDLAEYGLDARVLSIPGHSKGSIGILTDGGDLVCGDLLMNMIKPDIHFMIDDRVAFNASLKKIRGLPIHTVYPGHGKPFPLEKISR